LAGIASAQVKGIHCGRKPSLSDEQIEAVRKEKADGMTPTQLSKKYGVSRATIYNVLK
jgi:transposase